MRIVTCRSSASSLTQSNTAGGSRNDNDVPFVWLISGRLLGSNGNPHRSLRIRAARFTTDVFSFTARLCNLRMCWGGTRFSKYPVRRTYGTNSESRTCGL